MLHAVVMLIELGGCMDNNMKRKPVLEDTFLDSESKLKRALDETVEQPKFLVIQLKNNMSYIRKEIKTFYTTNGAQVLSLDLSKEIASGFNSEILSFINKKAQLSDKEKEAIQNPHKKIILLSGLDTDHQEMISKVLIKQWDLLVNDNYRIIFLALSEVAFQAIYERLKMTQVDSGVVDAREFTDRVKSQLSLYKKGVLGIDDDGKYLHEGKEYRFGYILPIGSELKNVIPYRSYVAQSILDGIDLHRYYHHLNSSQIMCINFFYPLMKEELLQHILTILDIPGEVEINEFEKASELEGSNYRKTKFDFYIKTKDGKNIYFEIKYTENGFGKAENDLEHQKKFTDVYEPKLRQTEVINSEFKSRETFFENYQIIRNVINIDENSYVVFLYPEENKGIRTGAKLARDEIINAAWSDHFKPITWEALTDELLNYLEDGELKKYYTDHFTKKYML